MYIIQQILRTPQDPKDSLLLTDNLLTIQVVSFSSPLFDFFCSVYSKKHFTCLFVGFTFFFSGSEFLFSFLLHQICIDALHGEKIYYSNKNNSYSSIFYTANFILRSLIFASIILLQSRTSPSMHKCAVNRT